MKSMGITAGKKYEKKRKILASEVNKQALQKTNVNDLREQINECEKKLKEEPTKADV